MTKADIIEEIVGSTGIARKDVSATVEAFMEVIKKSLLEDKENVYLRGFGSFIIKHRAEKDGKKHSRRKHYYRHCLHTTSRAFNRQRVL